MRKTIWIVPAFMLFSAIGTPTAHAGAIYTISFTGTNAPSVVGSDLVTYDPTAMDFTTPSIDILYSGTDYPLGLFLPQLVTSPTNDTFSWSAGTNCTGPPLPICGSSFISVNDQTTDQGLYAFLILLGGDIPSGEGTVTFTAATPEPSTYILMLSGIGLLGLMLVKRKPIARGFPQGA
jgi:hypothetical protein